MAYLLLIILLMKVAVPIWAGRVSPVLDVARRLVVAELEGRTEISRKEEPVAETDLFRRAQRIRQLGVDVLICGAVSRPLEDMLRANGVQVTPWVCGSVEEVLQAFLCGRLSEASFLMPGCCGRRRRFHGHRGGRGPFNKKGAMS